MSGLGELGDEQLAALFHAPGLPEAGREALLVEMGRRDAEQSAGTLMAEIVETIEHDPRSLQKALGPSELGIPCDRRIGFRLLGVEPVNLRPAPWLPMVGTAVHAWLEAVFAAANERSGVERYLLEAKVDVGTILGEAVTGRCDIFDTHTHDVWDWKVVGPAKLKDYRRNGPGRQYRVQAHAYGRGWQHAGQHVARVGIVFLPRSGELRDAHIWHEPYNEQIAVQALARVEGIAELVRSGKRQSLPLLRMADAYCQYCPFWTPGARDETAACPGHPESAANASPLDSLIPIQGTKENTR